ncbi:MAG: cation:proton antiporter [Candidatus Limnocylindria bacterium]
MPHDTGLLGTIAVAFSFALIGGFVAARLRLPPIVGYLLAGIAVGPFTPGFVADRDVAGQLAEHDLLDSIHGRIAVGWLIVEDIFTVLVLVLLPPLAELRGRELGGEGALDVVLLMAETFARVGLLAALMIVAGGRILPWLLAQVARTGSRELFTLSVLGVALGVAFGASQAFGVSLALGAFLAGAVVSESDLGRHAAAEALPLRDAFAVLFFVSVGMLFDPAILLAAPLALVAVLLLVVLGKGLAAMAIVTAFGYPIRTALVVAVGLAQVGEFSFILAALALDLGLLPQVGSSLILAAALISITLNPFLFRALPALEARLSRLPLLTKLTARRAGDLARLASGGEEEVLRAHAIICGYGQVGGVIAEALERRNFPYVVVELDRRLVEQLRAAGKPALYGDAANPELLAHAGLDRARILIVAIPDPMATRRIAEQARAARPDLEVVVRTHSEDEWRYLRGGLASAAVLGERELAIEMVSVALRRFGVSPMEIVAITRGLRRR